VFLKYDWNMTSRTVDWSALRGAATSDATAEGLRARKKRLMRQQLSDTATEMFLEHGFDAVRVSDVAEACGVSEKTVFNYFPSKEALILDRLDSTMASLKTELAKRGSSPLEAALRILDDELSALTSWIESQEDPALARSRVERFGAMIQTTASLRAYQRDMLDQLIAVTANALADRTGLSPDAPEVRIAATSLLGLWQVQSHALRKYLGSTRTTTQVRRAVTAEVSRAARVINAGLSTLEPTRQGTRRVRLAGERVADRL
jgi:AcrR family transcriptional regulator